MEQQPLVAGERGVGDTRIGAGDYTPHFFKVERRRIVALDTGRLQQVHRQERGHRDHDRERCTQRARRIALVREGPPQVRGVRHVAVCKHSDPNRERDDDRDARDPARRETLAHDRRRAPESASRKPQHQQHEAEVTRFLDVEPLQQRGADAGGQ